jgi:hypothetical protein
MENKIYTEVNIKENTQRQDLAFLNVTQVRQNFVITVFEDVCALLTVVAARETDYVCTVVNDGTHHSQILLWGKVSSITYI